MNDEYSGIQAAVGHLIEKCDGILSIREFLIQDISLRNKSCYSNDDVNILVRQMADHIGLHDSHFIIELTKIDDSISGRIYLQERVGFTKILIDSDLVRHSETLMMVLSHELTHKYLHEHSAELADANANEKLTDIASVFLGFGKYILNGKHYSENFARGVRNVSVGYLTDSEFALAYDVSCFQRGLTEDAILDGLSGGARKCLWDVRTKHRERYPKRILQLRKAQVDLQCVKMNLDECTATCPYNVKGEIDKLRQWHAYLKDQFRDVAASTVPDVLQKYVERLKTCEENVSKLLEDIRHAHKIEVGRRYDDVDALIAKLKIINGMAKKSFKHANKSKIVGKCCRLFDRIKNEFRSMFSWANLSGAENWIMTKCRQLKTIRGNDCRSKRNIDEVCSIMSNFKYQIGQSVPANVGWALQRNGHFEIRDFLLKSKLFDFCTYSLYVTPKSRKVFAIKLESFYKTRDEADSQKEKILAWLAKSFAERRTDCSGVRSWWMGSEESGTYVTLECSNMKWSTVISVSISLMINNVDAKKEADVEIAKTRDEKMNEMIVRHVKFREELKTAAEGEFRIVNNITPATLWHGQAQGMGYFLPKEIFRVSVKLKPEIYKRIESGEFRRFRIAKKSDLGKRLSISNRRRIGAVIFVSGSETFPREVMCWEVIEELDAGDAYSLGLGMRVT